MKKLLLAAMVLLAACGARAQGYIYSQPVLNSRGALVAGANVAVCTTVTTTAASVTNNIATLTMASNPVTGGFTQGSTLIVSQFSGSDIYFNGTYTIAAINSTTISYGLTHANSSATTNGVAVQKGTTSTACAPLATIYTDQTLAITTPNPFTTDAFGNLTFAAPSQNYQVQIYGPTVTLSIYTTTVPLAWNTAGNVVTTQTIAAIQTALNAGGAGSTVIVPPGVYAGSSGLTITSSNQHLICSGIGSTTISYTGTAALAAVIDVGTSDTGSANLNGITINGCTILGNTHVTDGIRARGSQRSDYSHNSIGDVTGACIHTSFAVVGNLDDVHCSTNEGNFAIQTPANCFLLTGPDSSHTTTSTTIKSPVCEGVSGSGIKLDFAFDDDVYNGTSEGNNVGWEVSGHTSAAKVYGTDFELNTTANILSSCAYACQAIGVTGNAGGGSLLTHILTGNNTFSIIGGAHGTITIDAGAIGTSLVDTLFTTLNDAGTSTAKYHVWNGASFDADKFPGVVNATAYQVSGSALATANIADISGWTNFSPALPVGGSASSTCAGTLTTTSATGRYFKTGKLVTFEVTATLTTVGTGGTCLKVTLPFTAGATANFSVSGFESGSTNMTHNCTLLANGTTMACFKYDGTFAPSNGWVITYTGTYESST